jgi:hypothetical protein
MPITELSMDLRWSIFASTQTFEMFCKDALPEIYLKPEVPDQVVKSMQLVKSLLEFSYFNYEFYDEAALRALLTFEMAVNIRAKEVGIFFTENDSLKKKIDRFNRAHYFEVYNDDYLNGIRKTRNLLIHTTSYGYAGPFKRHLIVQPLNLINDLYENPILREQRKNIQKSVRLFLRPFRHNGFLLKGEGTDYLCFEYWLHINNKISPKQFIFKIKPIFHIPSNFIDEKKLYESPTYMIVASKININNNILTLIDFNGEEYTLSSIENEDQQGTFDNWIKLYNNYDDFTGDQGSLGLEINRSFQEFMNMFYREEI